MTLEAGDCRALGSRLKDIADSFVNNPFDFTIGDWVLEGYYYTINITVAMHNSQQYPIFQVYEKIGLEYHSVAFDSIILKSNGDFKVFVLSDPDLRFNGRLILDE